MVKKPTGRPPIVIDEKKLERFALANSPTREIAGLLGCEEGSLRRRYAKLLEKHRYRRRLQLREQQWKIAMSGTTASVTMLIWLGKNELDQTDKQELKHDGSVKIEVIYVPNLSAPIRPEFSESLSRDN